MLTKCPECELQISTKALVCPHCGYPLKSSVPYQSRPKKPHKRLPNGFGQISMIKNRPLRKPYRAMVSIGKNDVGHPISKTVGYYETYNDAYTALVEYQKNPYDLNAESITLKELYAKWSEHYFKTLNASSSKRTITSAWAKCSTIENIKVKELRARHIKEVMENVDSASIKGRVKSLFNLMLDYAVEYEIVDRNYARTFANEKAVPQTEHIVFTNDEISILWQNSGDPIVDMILIQCYTGFRPQELCRLKNADVHDTYVIGGMKTDAGRNRYVPLHSKIRSLVSKYRNESEFLFLEMTYDKYRHRFEKTVERLRLNTEHRAHDPRKTFITMAKKSGVDEYAIKYIVGHAISDLTESTYTKRDTKWLDEEIEKISM